LEAELAGEGVLGESGSGDIWDGLIGLRAHFDLTERWYLLPLGDVGAGDSDILAQLYAGAGYRFESFGVGLGLRVMYFDFGSGAPLEDQLIYGPILSGKFAF
jgi:hypothetical protein